MGKTILEALNELVEKQGAATDNNHPTYDND